MLEINSNPSFNINIQKFDKVENIIGGTEYKLKNEVSEIDKFIKCMVLTDAFKILTCGEDSVKKLGSFTRLYPHEKYNKFDILDDIRIIFKSLTG